MRELLVAFGIAFGGSDDRPSDPWFSTDKLKHFFTAAFVQSAAYGTLRATKLEHQSSLYGASAVTVLVGVGKELHDRRAGGFFSYRDLAWDAAGAGAASVMLDRTRR